MWEEEINRILKMVKDSVDLLCVVDREKKQIVVDNRFVICYNNSYFWNIDGTGRSRSIDLFIKRLQGKF